MTAPDKPETPAQPTSPNAPAFVPDQSAAQEITRLNGLLDAERAKTTQLTAQVTALEGQVDDTKAKDLEARLSALEAENATLKGENDTLKGDKTRAEQLGQLSGKVRDPEAALKLLTDDLKNADGTPDVEKIIGKYPYLAPEGTTTPTAPSGAGGPQTPAATTLDAAVASKDTAAINSAFEAELKGGNQ